MWASIAKFLARAATWVFPSLVGWVAGDVINAHEQRNANDTLRDVAISAAGAARTNWVKWLMLGLVGLAVSGVLALFFRFKFKTK